jgi:drug/metabolite transporter (DMT)-like permease
MTDPISRSIDDAGSKARSPLGGDWLAYVVLVLAVLFMVGNVIAGRAVREVSPPGGLTFWRSVLAVVLLLPFVPFVWRTQIPRLLAHWRFFFFLGLVWGVGGHFTVVTGLQTTTAINAGLIATTQPALAFLGAWLIFGDPISRHQIAGVVVGLAGVTVIVARGDLDVLLSLDFVPGDFWVQAGMVGFVVFTVLIKRLPPAINPLAAIGAVAFAAAICLAPVYAYEVLVMDRITHADVPTVQAIFYLAICATLIAVPFLHIGVSRLGPGRATVFFYLSPVFAAGLAITLLGESFHGYHGAGMVLVLAGIALANRRAHRRGTQDG